MKEVNNYKITNNEETDDDKNFFSKFRNKNDKNKMIVKKIK